MNWEMLIIPLIALGVWILSAIFRGAEEERDKERLAKPPEQGRRMRQPRRAQTELDRFLDEARNRRLGAAKPAAEEVPQLREEVPQAVPVAQPVNPRPQPKRSRAERPASPEPRRSLEPPPAPLRPAPEPPLAQPVAPPPPSPSQSAPAAPIAASAPPGGVVAIVPPTRPRPMAPAAVKLMKLLGDKQTLATAALLHEVLGKPLCRRRGF